MSGALEENRSDPSRVRDQRLEIRCYEEEKNLLRKAAALDNRTLSNWLLHVAIREARSLLAAGSGAAPTVGALSAAIDDSSKRDSPKPDPSGTNSSGF